MNASHHPAFMVTGNLAKISKGQLNADAASLTFFEKRLLKLARNELKSDVNDY